VAVAKRRTLKTPHIMLWVVAALIPGTVAMSTVWGLGVWWNVVGLVLFCSLVDALASFIGAPGPVHQRWAHLRHSVTDYSTLVTAWLMAICMPPYADLSILLVAAIAAVALAKHAYGGLGRNVFNPAMVGYAVVLISFPQGLADWPPLLTDQISDQLTRSSAQLTTQAAATAGVLATGIDALSGATPLSEFRYRQGLTVLEFESMYAAALSQQVLISGAFALGGLSLWYAGIIAWRIPLAMLGGVALGALIGADQGSSASLGGVWFHATTGGFAAAAFFVATDPVTHPKAARDQIYFGLLIGVLIYVIRGLGSFPDGIAFAVLLGNC